MYINKYAHLKKLLLICLPQKRLKELHTCIFGKTSKERFIIIYSLQTIYCQQKTLIFFGRTFKHICISNTHANTCNLESSCKFIL